MNAENNLKKLAIDVVILLPDDIRDLAIKWNQALHNPNGATIQLDSHNYLPHISLAMGCIRGHQVEQVCTSLSSIAAEHRSLTLSIPELKCVTTQSGNRVVSFDISPAPALTFLHESAVATFKPFLTQDATELDLYDPPPVDSGSLDWINHYVPHHCYRHFWPHITVGYGETQDHFQPVTFRASRLAICQLGNYCTCRRILGEVFMNP